MEIVLDPEGVADWPGATFSARSRRLLGLSNGAWMLYLRV
jgi:hypothetical protein